MFRKSHKYELDISGRLKMAQEKPQGGGGSKTPPAGPRVNGPSLRQNGIYQHTMKSR